MNFKYVMFCLLILQNAITNSCNLCWGYPYTGERLRQVPIQKLDDCNCECWLYPHTKGDNNFYVCTVCDHRLTPEDVLNPNNKSKQYIRWTQKTPTRSYKKAPTKPAKKRSTRS